MRKLFALLLLIAGFAGSARAESATTLPSLKGLTPKQTLIAWQDRVFSAAAGEVVNACVCKNDTEKQFAAALADAMIVTARLQKAASLKWGRDADSAVLRACQSDTAEDDQQATETISGDRAVVTFKQRDLQPIPLTLVNGIWKFDIAACVARSPEYTIAQQTAYTKLITVVVAAETATLDQGKFSDSDSLAKDLAAQLAKLQPPPR